MDGISTERALLSGAISPELEAAFRTVADADLGGGRKYAPAIMRALSRTVAARAYGKPMLELCHLLRVADAVGGRHGWPALIFGVQVARGPAFRAHVQDGARRCPAFGQDFRLEADGVTIAYPDGPFTVSYGRMGFLAALLELMVTALGYRAVDAEIRAWLDAPFDGRRATAHANALSRLFYDHLREHLSTAQSLRIFARIVGFLEADRGGGFTLDDLDDRAVLDYWHRGVTAGDEDAAELRGFRAVTERFGMLRTALQAAFERHAVDTAAPVGPDRDAGEVDPGTILALVEAHDGEADELRALQGDPAAAVKFLTGKEVGELDLIARLGSHAGTLALSVLRASTFGAVQARLSQAMRRRAPEAEVAALIGLSACETYGQRLEQWRRLERRLDRMALAALAVLVDADRAEAALEVLAWVPAADLSGLRDRLPSAEDGPNVVALRPGGVAGMVAALADPTVVGPDVAGLIADARRALRGLARSGFAPEDRRSGAAVDGMAAGAPLVRRLLVRLQTVRATAEKRIGDGGFARDADRFRDGFRALYGAAA
ncbi:hypothetical protein T8K17_13195 [Thalassobaculum sp. OXR-137]|uniref:hypothetical protein n=1 Tax=Thalassobaculum sp. OXR-137 TaxID=3100173 RepID=UPI002AC90A98|nr:hypothetical protein [Thalassobaculum sp. OXR-137]WPZ32197.1 hypothetical protein T8K17_13195 [Thalassobaculum sp. OXR-137]